MRVTPASVGDRDSSGDIRPNDRDGGLHAIAPRLAGRRHGRQRATVNIAASRLAASPQYCRQGNSIPAHARIWRLTGALRAHVRRRAVERPRQTCHAAGPCGGTHHRPAVYCRPTARQSGYIPVLPKYC
jgi:hypothetical protein